jgi:hypothetical protein
VVVIADNDPTGLRYASRWVEALTGVARSVRIARPGVDTPKADLTDHLHAGLGPHDLRLMEEPASLGDVLDEVRSWLGTYVSMASDHGLTVLSLWAAHTHAMESWYTTPRILLTSALPGCGKTTALEHLQHLTPNALLGSTASPALLARATQAGPRPLLLDESDLLLDRKREGVGDLTALLNSGYKRGGSRPTLLPRKDSDWAIVEMPTYAPVAFAGIGDHLPEPTLTRTIVLHLDRAAPGAVADSDWQFIEAACHELRDRLALTVGAHVERMATIRPSMNVTGRDAEVWRPLITLADAAGGHWPQTAREALNYFLSERQADQQAGLVRESPSLTLLKDLKAVWPQDDAFLGTADLIRLLADHAPEVWGEETRSGTISGKRLSQLLRAYRIRPTQGQGKTKRGYFLSDFRTPWATYVDPSADPSEASQPSNESRALSATDEEAVCTWCGQSMDPILSDIGHTTHPLCHAA